MSKAQVEAKYCYESFLKNVLLIVKSLLYALRSNIKNKLVVKVALVKMLRNNLGNKDSKVIILAGD